MEIVYCGNRFNNYWWVEGAKESLQVGVNVNTGYDSAGGGQSSHCTNPGIRSLRRGGDKTCLERLLWWVAAVWLTSEVPTLQESTAEAVIVAMEEKNGTFQLPDFLSASLSDQSEEEFNWQGKSMAQRTVQCSCSGVGKNKMEPLDELNQHRSCWGALGIHPLLQNHAFYVVTYRIWKLSLRT